MKSFETGEFRQVEIASTTIVDCAGRIKGMMARLLVMPRCQKCKQRISHAERCEHKKQEILRKES